MESKNLAMTEQKPLNVTILAYRDWAFPICEMIQNHPRVNQTKLLTNYQDYVNWFKPGVDTQASQNFVSDLVMFCGWSDQPDPEILKMVPHVGLHCAESDKYSAGTPLQNQILDGIDVTTHRVFNVGYPELSRREWCYETKLSLQGNMSDVLEQMTATGKFLYRQFLNDWPNVEWKKWPQVNENMWSKKRTPQDSMITKNQFSQMSTKELYDFFRCLESPYPNGYIEDDFGKLYIEKVSFKRK